MACRSIKPDIDKICTADLNKKIKIQFTSSAPNNNPGSNAGTTFKDLKTVWAMIKTKASAEFMVNVNVQRTITTEFYIRFDASIDFKRKLWVELWVEYNNSRYDVINFENLGEQNKFIKLTATERGKKTVNANQR
jgi:SPP1 family predicted phage head-tail adaptor